MEKNPFANFKLRYKPSSMEYLREEELTRIEQKTVGTPMLEKVRDFFVFSCYTGLAYIDLVAPKPHNILTTADGLQWIRTTRMKTDIPVNVPLLPQALENAGSSREPRRRKQSSLMSATRRSIAA